MKIDWDDLPLGKEMDAVIARRLGVSGPTVRRARVERGIPKPSQVGKRAGKEYERVDWGKFRHLFGKAVSYTHLTLPTN